MPSSLRIIVLSEIAELRSRYSIIYLFTKEYSKVVILCRREHRINLQCLRDCSDPFQLPNFRFQKLFRVDKMGVKILLEKLEPYSRNSSIPFTLRFLCALHFYGHGSYQASIGSCHILALSQPSVSRSIKEVTALINDHLVGDLIQFPTDVITVAETKQRYTKINYFLTKFLLVLCRFFSKFGMQGIIGVIDGCHIAIVAPPEDDFEFSGNHFRNRKGYHSLNALVVSNF